MGNGASHRLKNRFKSVIGLMYVSSEFLLFIGQLQRSQRATHIQRDIRYVTQTRPASSCSQSVCLSLSLFPFSAFIPPDISPVSRHLNPRAIAKAQNEPNDEEKLKLGMKAIIEKVFQIDTKSRNVGNMLDELRVTRMLLLATICALTSRSQLPRMQCLHNINNNLM